jgi:amino acid transporter
MSLSSTAETIFSWLKNLVSISTQTNWTVITITYLLRLLQAGNWPSTNSRWCLSNPTCHGGLLVCLLFCFQQVDSLSSSRDSTFWISIKHLLPQSLCSFFINEIQPFILTRGCLLTWDNQTFMSTYINNPLFYMLYFGYKFIRRPKIIALSGISIEHFLVIAEREVKEPRKLSTRWQWLTLLWEWSNKGTEAGNIIVYQERHNPLQVLVPTFMLSTKDRSQYSIV